MDPESQTHVASKACILQLQPQARRQSTPYRRSQSGGLWLRTRLPGPHQSNSASFPRCLIHCHDQLAVVAAAPDVFSIRFSGQADLPSHRESSSKIEWVKTGRRAIMCFIRCCYSYGRARQYDNKRTANPSRGPRMIITAITHHLSEERLKRHIPRCSLSNVDNDVNVKSPADITNMTACMHTFVRSTSKKVCASCRS